MLTFNITTSEREIQQAIGDTIARHCYNAVYNPLSKLQNQVNSFIEDSIGNSPEADDLINGFLRNEFGLVNPQENVKSIIQGVIKAAKVDKDSFKYTGRDILQGKITIGVLQTDLREVLSLPDASYVSEGKNAGEVKWLEWLLLGGEDIVLNDFIISYSPVHQRFSRTGGGALMFPGQRGYAITSSGFVPPQFTGTIKDNWLTRALSKIDRYLSPLIEQEFRRAFF